MNVRLMTQAALPFVNSFKIVRWLRPGKSIGHRKLTFMPVLFFESGKIVFFR
jgi:hypothetical protein